MKYAEVIIGLKAKELDRIYYYIIPDKLIGLIEVGMRVSVPFGRGNRKTEGYVIGICDEAPTKHTLKEISALKDGFPVFSKERIELAKWMANKYYCTLTECLQCIIPKIAKDKTVKYISPCNMENAEALLKRSKRQAEIAEFLKKTGRIELDRLMSELNVSSASVLGLVEKGLAVIDETEVIRDFYKATNAEKKNSPTPTADQQRVINEVVSDLEYTGKKPFLLMGVTGSGKTLVYMEIVDKALKMGKQAIVLVPEISLTPQTVQRFIERFGELVSVTHSGMTDGERYDQWKKARTGRISVMIGPRSALFAPFDNLGVVILDEEHEKTYKSDISPKYDAIETAIKLQEIYGTTVVLGSATPSINSYYKALQGEYRLLELKNRINMKFPDIYAVDMRDEIVLGNKSMFSIRLQKAIGEALADKKQVILFLNRRGHSTFVSCRKCGYVFGCESCSVNYTYHKRENKLVCHYCGAEEDIPEVCPGCGSKYIKYFGIGTEKIMAEVNKLFPEARVLRMDADTTKTRDSHRQILSAFARGEADVLVGTQMIAKGLDFPRVVLVGVVAADMSLNSSDFRAAENTFQLITQVAGRAGRADNVGKVLIQTYMPENYCIQYAKKNDYVSFYKEEIEFRRQMKYPPFTNLCTILFSGEDEKTVITRIHELAAILEFYGKGKNYERIGPAAAMVSKIHDKYRHRIIIKGLEEEKLKNYAFYCLNKLREREDMGGISVNVTINPKYIP